MSRIFISHSSKDNFEAVALRDWLAAHGWNDVFLDLDPERGIAAGERWERALHEAANRCEAVIFLISANWLASGWCLKEYALARGLNKKLFAALVDPGKTISDLPPELADRSPRSFASRCRARMKSGTSRSRPKVCGGCAKAWRRPGSIRGFLPGRRRVKKIARPRASPAKH
jgi:hypothetical protein